MTASYVLTSLLVVTLVPFYYSLVDGRITSLSKPLLLFVGVPKAYSYKEGRSVLRLGLAGAAQLAFWAGLLAITAVPAASAFEAPLRPSHVLFGVLLGIAEMALSSFLCHLIVKAIMALAPSFGPTRMEDWVTVARGGWMREYLNALDTAPLPAAVGLTVLYVGVEELVFRGVLIPFARPLGVAGAVGLSTLLFASVQVFQLPSLRAAIFPVVGACVMGVIHGALFAAVPNIVPLVVAHCVFFLVAVR